MMHRLYLQVYATCLVILLLFAVLAGAAWSLRGASAQERRALDGLGVLLAEALPPADAEPSELQPVVDRLHARLPGIALSVHDAGGRPLAAAGAAAPRSLGDRRETGWLRPRRGGPGVVVKLPDERWIVLRHAAQPGEHAAHAAALLGLLGVAIGVGAYPVVRRLTGRLERLQHRVEQLGEGDLTARVDVEGDDEVAELARSFNRAAERIEQLVRAQRELLASVSHELRSPLARLRLASELAAADRPELNDRLAGEIDELDGLIGELLLNARLEANVGLEAPEDVDLLALAAEEAARTGARVEGDPVTVLGDQRLLRRLVRNLLENGSRHAADGPVVATVRAGPTGRAVLTVSDRGPGIPEAERERVFEPFHRLRGASGKGSGLGLALVRGIARRHGGDARCLPAPGGGTAFEVTLPLGPVET